MRHGLVSCSLLLMAMFLGVVPTALASGTWYVDGVHGSDNNDCKTPQTACKTIGHAISLAASGDSVMVAAATYSENLTININLKVIGAGATTTIIDGGGRFIKPVVTNTASAVALSKVTIRNGNGGGIFNAGGLKINNSTISGNHALAFGGIFNYSGTLTINNSTISGNLAAYCCFQYGRSSGGGIQNAGTLAISNSTLSGNSARVSCTRYCVSSGGGIQNAGTGTLAISNSTISGNSARVSCTRYCVSSGGGISSGGALSISNSTISGNSASASCNSCRAFGGGISGSGTISNSTISGNTAELGGGIDGTATLQNSIVANNSGGNCNGTMTSNGYNLSSDGSCNFNNTGDLNNTDPLLGQLGNYGGPTQTLPLLTGSPAIDAGNPKGCTDGQGHLLKTDQRGKPRHDKEDTGGCDMGAYERQKD